MAWPEGPSGDDRSPDPFADGPGDDSTLAVSIPNDASELAAEVSAYQRELRSRRRRQRIDRLIFARYWRPYGLTGPIVLTALVLVGSISGLLLALLPATGSSGQAKPLAQSAYPEGAVHGPLLNDPVFVDGAPKSAQALRPGLLVLIPIKCDCASLIDHIAVQAREFGNKVYVVTGVNNDAQMGTVTHTSVGNLPQVVDLGYKLRDQYAPAAADQTGVTVVAVQPDGIVADVLNNVILSVDFHGVLTQLNSSA